MSKRPTDHLEPAAKKRGSERQLTKDDASGSDDDAIVEKGQMQMASEEVLKARRMVRTRRGTAAPPSTPASGVPVASSNPFAGVNLLAGSTKPSIAQVPAAQPTIPTPAVAAVAPPEAAKSTAEAPADAQRTASVEAQDTTKPTASQELAKPKATAESTPTTSAPATEPLLKDSPVVGVTVASTSAPSENGTAAQTSFASFASNSAPFASAGANKPLFNFGSLANGTSTTDQDPSKPKPFSFGPLPTSGAFAFPSSSAGAFPAVPGMFGAKPATPAEDGKEDDTPQPDNIKPALAVLPPETETVTGEEDESQLWAGEGTLYEFTPPQSWKERGKGEMRINKGAGRPARFVLRQRGHHRLLMNANLWADMKITKMDGGKGATFSVANAAQSEEGSADAKTEVKHQTFAFRVRTAAQMDAFIEAVNLHKGSTA